MKDPTVRQARAMCDSLKARAVIILAFDEDSVAGASYGETKLECSQAVGTMNHIVEELEEGRIPVWRCE